VRQPGGKLGAGAGIAGNSKQPLTNTVSRNNIFQVWRGHWPAINEAGGSGNDFDYDLSNGRLSEKHGVSGGADKGLDRGVRIPNFNDNFSGARRTSAQRKKARRHWYLAEVVRQRQVVSPSKQ